MGILPGYCIASACGVVRHLESHFMSQIYRIREWSTRYENNRSRELKTLSWVMVPNDQSSDGYSILMDREDGPQLWGAWVAILQIASRCDVRGTLMRDGAVPHDSASLSRISRIPKSIIEKTLEVCFKECKWLEINEVTPSCENPAPSCDNPARLSVEQKGREGKGIEQNIYALGKPAHDVASNGRTSDGYDEEPVESEPVEPTPPKQLKQKKGRASSPAGPMKVLTDRWCSEWGMGHGQKYHFKPKDGVQAAELLKMDIPIDTLSEIWCKAWKLPEKNAFEKSMAIELSSFVSQFNRIRQAVGLLKPVNGHAKATGGFAHLEVGV